MKLQIINCLDLLYPYQVMRIVKKTSSCELVYDVKGNYAAASVPWEQGAALQTLPTQCIQGGPPSKGFAPRRPSGGNGRS